MGQPYKYAYGADAKEIIIKTKLMIVYVRIVIVIIRNKYYMKYRYSFIRSKFIKFSYYGSIYMDHYYRGDFIHFQEKNPRMVIKCRRSNRKIKKKSKWRR